MPDRSRRGFIKGRAPSAGGAMCEQIDDPSRGAWPRKLLPPLDWNKLALPEQRRTDWWLLFRRDCGALWRVGRTMLRGNR